MLNVVATVKLKPGCKGEFLGIFKAFAPKVRAESGCIAYEPCLDEPSGYSTQPPVRDEVVTVVERWRDMEAFHAHQKFPHMLKYIEDTQNLVDSVAIQVLKPQF